MKNSPDGQLFFFSADGGLRPTVYIAGQSGQMRRVSKQCSYKISYFMLRFVSGLLSETHIRNSLSQKSRQTMTLYNSSSVLRHHRDKTSSSADAGRVFSETSDRGTAMSREPRIARDQFMPASVR